MRTLELLTPRRLRLFALGLISLGLYLFWVIAGPAGTLRGQVAAILVLVLQVAAAMVAARWARAQTSASMRRSSVLFAASLLLWAIASLWEVGLWVLIGARPPIPSMTDLLMLAGYLSGIVAFAIFPATPPERFGRLRALLDVLVLSIAVATLGWLVFLRPILMLGFASPLLLAWTGVRPISDLILAILLLRLVLIDPEGGERRFFHRLLLAYAILAVSDLAYGYLVVRQDWAPGGLIELGWAAFTLIALVALQEEARRPTIRRSRTMAASQPRRRIGVRLEAMLSLALVYVVVGFTVADWWAAARPDWVGIAAAVLLSILLVARQGVIAGQVEMRRFAALVNASADMAFICDSDGKLLLTNPAFLSALAMPPLTEGVQRLDASRVLSTPPVEDLLRDAARDGWSGEVSFRRGDGSSFPTYLSLRPLEEGRGAKRMIAGTAHDLSETKKRELDLRSALREVAAARAELEELNAALEEKVEARTLELQQTVLDLERLNEDLKALDQLKTEFVALVSHELRAPLTNIRSGVELIVDRTPDLGASVKEVLQLVQQETGRLGSFVESILDLSALEAGRFRVHPEAVPIQETVRSVWARFPRHVGGDRLEVEIPDSLPPVHADESALGSVLFHLIDNAVKYAPSGPIHVRARVEGEVVAIEVIDHGPGIPAEERERIFDRFHRLDSSDAREVYGHGLGLYLARRLLETMGGAIEASEADGGGARFQFWLPMATIEQHA